MYIYSNVMKKHVLRKMRNDQRRGLEIYIKILAGFCGAITRTYVIFGLKFRGISKNEGSVFFFILFLYLHII